MKGYGATGLNEIIAASGAPKGSLYYYFPKGKLQLAEEAVRYSGSLINGRVAQRLAEQADAASAFRRIIEDMVERFSTHDPHFEDVSLSIIALEASSETESLRRACEEALDERERLFREKLLASGYATEEARRLAGLVLLLIEGAITAAQTRNDPAALLAISSYLPTLLGSPSA
jgi:Transcriptional regulator